MKSIKLIVLAILLAMNLSAQYCSDGDREVLEQLWLAWDKPELANWDYENGGNNELNNSWEGITMTMDGCNISGISLAGVGLGGYIAQEIGLLEELVFLQIPYNSIGGELPHELISLENLTFLDVSINSLIGNIPSSLYGHPSLTAIILTGNNLSGSLHPNLGYFPNLEHLRLGNNNFSGTIPTELGLLTNLTQLSINGNNLTGTIPEELGQLNNMVILNTGSNSLSGSIPVEIAQLPNLQSLQSHNNNHTGTLPEFNYNGGMNSRYWMHSNNFSGCIPETLIAWCADPSSINIDNNPLLDIDDFDTFCTSGIGLCIDPEDDFVTTWKTANPGSSNDQTIFIPTVGGGPLPYNYDVDWEDDGVFDDFGVTGSISHSYPASGQFTVRIRGDFPRIYFNDNFDKEKIVSVDQWGTGDWSSMFRAFRGCTNLSVIANDVPNLSETTSLNQMFANNGTIYADLSAWDVSTIPSMFAMFNGSELSTEHYDALLISWSQQLLLPDVPFDAGSSEYCDGEYARQGMMNNYNWSITDGGEGTGCNPDIDGDGVLNEVDCDPYDPLYYLGSSCDDGNPSTVVDVIGENCLCQGYVAGPNCTMPITVTEGITYCPGIALLGGASATDECFGSGIGTDAVWYKYTATVCDEVTVSSGIDPNDPDTRLSIHTDCSEIDCLAFDDDDGPGGTSVASFMAEAGETYYIEWDDRWSDNGFIFEISMAENNCPVDLDQSGSIDGADFSLFLGNFGLSCTDPCGCSSDLDGNGVTNGLDFNILLGNFGLNCPPE